MFLVRKHSAKNGSRHSLISSPFNSLMDVICLRSQSSIICIVARLWAGRPEAQIPIEARDFSLVQNTQTSSGSYPASCLMGNEALSGVEWPKREVVNHSSPPSADIKNWGYTYSPHPSPICLNGVDKDSLMFVHVSFSLLFLSSSLLIILGVSIVLLHLCKNTYQLPVLLLVQNKFYVLSCMLVISFFSM